MKYCSIDIETTGLDENIHQIIEFAAILEDTNKSLSFEQIPKFRRIILNPKGIYNFSSYACNMNTRIIQIISKLESTGKFEGLGMPNLNDGYCYDYELGEIFTNFLREHKIFNRSELNAAGKNFKGFDQKHLMKLPKFNDHINFSYRGLDPGSVFIDWETDESVPNTEKCKVRAGLPKEVSHHALEDAWDVIQLFRFDKKQKEELKFLRNRYKPIVEEIS